MGLGREWGETTNSTAQSRECGLSESRNPQCPLWWGVGGAGGGAESLGERQGESPPALLGLAGKKLLGVSHADGQTSLQSSCIDRVWWPILDCRTSQGL